MMYHSLAKSALFLFSGNILLKYSTTKMDNVRGMISTLPITSVLFFTAFLAMAGIPPFGIFITEFTILAAGIQAHPVVTCLALLSLVIVVAGILGHVVGMLYGEPGDGIPAGEAGWATIIPAAVLVAVLVAVSLYVPGSLRALLMSATLNH
jgi:hydrogenase-4 component F